MKVSKKNQLIARRIFRACLEKESLDETKIEKFIDLLHKDTTSESKEILVSLKDLIEQFENSKKLIVESAFDIDEKQKAELKNYFENLVNKKLELVFKINKGLIGGIKVINSDFQWENSVVSNLQKMKGFE